MGGRILSTPPDARAAEAVAGVWNRAAVGRHAFFPWNAKLLLQHWSGWTGAAQLFLALREDEPVGFAHAAWTEEDYYEPAGTVAALAVAPEARGGGVGRALLQAALQWLEQAGCGPLDALGAWPVSPLYAGLADGSERSGIFIEREPGLAALFARAGFQPVRESFIMRASPRPGAEPGAPAPDGEGDGPPPPPWPRADARQRMTKRGAETWLDTVFRAWTLWDWLAVDGRDDVLTRSIFTRMDGLSDHLGRDHYALFGVHTPLPRRRQGLAGVSLARLLAQLAARGAAAVELHVYADNDPALALYRGLGFEKKERTVMYRRR